MTIIRFAILLLTFVAGRQSAPPTPAPAPASAPAVDGPIRKDVAPVAALDIFPLKEAKYTYTYVDGRRKGRSYSSQMGPAGDNTWKDVDGGIDTRMLREKDGAIFVVREEDSEEKVRVEYEPPLELLPARLEVGKPRETRCRMTVYDLTTGNVREEGECIHIVEYIGNQKRHTSAGELDTCRTRAVRRMQLRLAKVEVVIEVAAVPGRGKVWSRVERDTRALGLFSVKSVEEVKLETPKFK